MDIVVFQHMYDSVMTDEFSMNLNSVEQWRQRWNNPGLAGLYQSAPQGTAAEVAAAATVGIGESAPSEGGTVGAPLRHLKQCHDQASISEGTTSRYLKEWSSAVNATATV